jgi:hypothetical protein
VREYVDALPLSLIRFERGGPGLQLAVAGRVWRRTLEPAPPKVDSSGRR